MTSAERNEIAMRHCALVRWVARRMWRKLRATRTAWSDAIQAGWISLLRAVELHDASKGTLATYAVKCIRGGIIREINKNQMIHVPAPIQESLRPWKEQARRVVHLEGRDVGLKDCQPRGWADISDPTPKPSDCGDEELLRQAMQSLTPRCRQILLLRAEGKTLEECGKHYGFTRERVRQFEAKGMDRLVRQYGLLADLRKAVESNRRRISLRKLA